MVCEVGAFLKARTFMKKSILFAALLCLGNLAVAENLQFVTTLSSPLGTFAQLETADPTVMAKSPVVNFCNTRVSAGTITLNGANSYLQKLNLKASTTLGGNIKEYRIGTGLTVNADSNITGGRLMGSNVTFDGSVDAKSDVTGTLYLSNAATVQGAKTTALTIGSAVQTSGTGSNEEMHWSNEYNRDYTSSGSATGSTYTSYLLKSVGGTVAQDCSVAPEGMTKKYKECSCGGTLYAKWDKEACEYVPYDAVDVEVSCMTYYCDSGDGAHINNSGCKISGNFNSSLKVPFYVYKYDYSFVTNSSSWAWKWMKQDSLQSGYAWTETCGWPDGYWTDSTSCVRGFGFSSSGAKSTTVTCGDCTYNVELVSDSSDEEWGSSYCDGRAF